MGKPHLARLLVASALIAGLGTFAESAFCQVWPERDGAHHHAV